MFDDAQAARAAIDDFLLEGLANGEKVIELAATPSAVIDGVQRDPGLRSAVERGQLEVRPWSDTYLAGGRFGASAMLAFIRRSIREVDQARFAGARLVGTMDWAVGGVEGVDELADYERGLNRILARPRVTVLCVYDAQRHSKERLEEVIRLHDLALVDGVRQDVGGGRLSPRERILAAAGLLFAEKGVARTGVDTLIEAAGVAKATFYRHFPSKDDLVVAWLRDPATRWLDRVSAVAEARATSPRDLVPRLFEAVGEWLEAEDYVGCPYLNTSVEVSDPAHPAAMAIRDNIAEIGSYLEDAIRSAGHRQPAPAARQVHALLAGAIALGAAMRSKAPALAARDAASQLLEPAVAGR